MLALYMYQIFLPQYHNFESHKSSFGILHSMSQILNLVRYFQDYVVDYDKKEHFIVETIKKAVHKVVNVFRPQNESLVETLNTSSLHGASLRFRLRPEVGFKQNPEVVNRYHMIYYLLATQYNTVKQYTRLLRLDTLLPVICGQFNV